MNASSAPVPVSENPARPGCLSEIGWFFSGAVLPIASLSFYRKVSQRRVGFAILFFLVFTVFIALLSTTAMGFSFLGATGNIREQYKEGAVPEITIRGGVAEVNGKQPFVYTSQEGTSGSLFVGIDTTGQITSIDSSRYAQGFLVTRTDLQVLSAGGRYQTVPLSEVNTLFGADPLVINGDTVAKAWGVFSVVITLFIFLFLVLWDSVLRLMVITMAALVLWGIGSLIRPKIGFGPFIISGLYAAVPMIYLSQLFHRIGASFVGLQTILLLIFWAVALVACLSREKFFSLDTPPRLWTALIGVPLLVMMTIDLFISQPPLYWKIVLWVVALLTGLALVGLRLFFHIRAMQGSSPTVPPAAA